MPEQSSKQQMIIDYIRNISEQLNQQYDGIMNRDRYDRAVEMFKDSELPYEEVIKQINALAEQVVKSYLEEREKRFNPELVKQYAISGFPTFLLFKEGKVIAKLSGYHEKSELLSRLMGNLH